MPNLINQKPSLYFRPRILRLSDKYVLKGTEMEFPQQPISNRHLIASPLYESEKVIQEKKEALGVKT